MAEKSHTKRWQRVFILVIACLFVFTSAALTITIVIQAATSDNSSDTSSKDANSQQLLTGTKEPNFTPLTKPIKKLKTKDLKVGKGKTVKKSDTVKADYVGWLADTGVIFDASSDHGGAQTFPLNGVIKGWTKGIPGMKVGGTRRLFIPAALGYGKQGTSGIPPNSDLVFDVTIKAIK